MRQRGVKTDATLCVWNEQLASAGSKIMNARAEFIRQVNESSAAVQSEKSSEKLNIRYVPSIKLDNVSTEELYRCLSEKESREAETGTSLYGIQRDDIEIFIDGREARLYASQGQQRTAALSMKIAQSEYIKQIKGEYPVLLLDDIMSELDINRRMYLAEHIRDKQVLITSTDTDLADRDTDTKLFRIQSGTVVQ